VTDAAGVAAGSKVGAGACFLDIEGDGDLDLYVANYVKFAYETHPERTADGHPVYPGPMDFDPEPDILFKNNGDGTFTDISHDSGIGQHEGTGMGVVAADYDGDGDTDIFVANDVAGNFFFQNDGTGTFEEVGLRNGTAYNIDGRALGSMGVDCGDYNNDGRLDFLMTSYARELPVVYRNLGGGLLEDVTSGSGMGTSALPHVTWGVGVADFDNDGFRDVFLACGHLQDNVELFDTSSSYELPNLLFRNLGDGRFADISTQCGDGMRLKRCSRGAGFDDLDNDGDIDVVVLNSRREPTVLRNDTDSGNHWLGVRLVGTATNRDGIGSRVIVTAGDSVQQAEVHGGRGYQGHFGTRLHFGLGRQAHVDHIDVRWHGGVTERYPGVAADRIVSLTQGQGFKDRTQGVALGSSHPGD
jgi:hypothetical protein